MFQHLQSTFSYGVATVTLHRPELHNAFNATMIAELTDMFRQLAQREELRACVLQGAGKSFCAGGDITWMRDTKLASEAENREDARRLAAMFETVNRLPFPLVGKIHGAALGGGTGLAACCDVVIATAEAQFGLTETRLGIVPAVISPYVVAKIGQGQARALFLSGRRFSADEALRIGLAHEVVADQEALEIHTQLALKEILKAGPLAAREAKRLIFDLSSLPAEEAKAHTAALIARIRTTEEAQEGMEALLQKRKPAWLTDS